MSEPRKLTRRSLIHYIEHPDYFGEVIQQEWYTDGFEVKKNGEIRGYFTVTDPVDEGANQYGIRKFVNSNENLSRIEKMGFNITKEECVIDREQYDV